MEASPYGCSKLGVFSHTAVVAVEDSAPVPLKYSPSFACSSKDSSAALALIT